MNLRGQCLGICIVLTFSMNSDAQCGLKITLLAEEQSKIIASENNVLQQKAGWNGNKEEVRISSAWRVQEGFRRGWDLVKPLSETLKDEKKLLSYHIAQRTLGKCLLISGTAKCPYESESEITHSLLIRTWVIQNVCVCVCTRACAWCVLILGDWFGGLMGLG